jgi:hypothetical protein
MHSTIMLSIKAQIPQFLSRPYVTRLSTITIGNALSSCADECKALHCCDQGEPDHCAKRKLLLLEAIRPKSDSPLDVGLKRCEYHRVGSFGGTERYPVCEHCGEKDYHGVRQG